MIECHHVTDEHVNYVARWVRHMDRRECEEIYNTTPLDGLRESVARSPWCGAIISRGELICIVGVARDGGLLTRCGLPWLIGVEGIEQHPRAFAVLTGPIIKRMEAEDPLLSNVVLQENTLSINWLTRAGFELGDPEMIGGAACLRFRKARDGLVCDSGSGECGSKRLRVC